MGSGLTDKKKRDEIKRSGSNVLRVDKLGKEFSYCDSLESPSVLLSINNRRHLTEPKIEPHTAESQKDSAGQSRSSVRRMPAPNATRSGDRTTSANNIAQTPAIVDDGKGPISPIVKRWPRHATRTLLVSLVCASVIILIATQVIVISYFSTNSELEQFSFSQSTMNEHELSTLVGGVLTGTTNTLNNIKDERSAAAAIPTLRYMSEQIRDIHDVLSRIPQDSQRLIMGRLRGDLGRLDRAATDAVDTGSTHAWVGAHRRGTSERR